MDHVEKHIIMAKAAALAAEEKALSTLDQQLGLPKGKTEHCLIHLIFYFITYFRSMPIAT